MPANEAQKMMAYDAHKKSALIAYLLWWFLGGFGAHRFYLGRTGSAVAMLVITLVSMVLVLVAVGLLGILAIGIWWLIDAFLIPGIVRQHNTRLASQIG